MGAAPGSGEFQRKAGDGPAGDAAGMDEGEAGRSVETLKAKPWDVMPRET